jgi:NADH dehydrogenase
MKRYIIPKDFPVLDISKMEINLDEASLKLLSVMFENTSLKSYEYLYELGININLNAKVVSYDGTYLILADETSYKTDTVI